MARKQDYPTAIIAKRVRHLRTRRGLTAEELATQMRNMGVPFDKTVVANLETGRRRFVTVQEMLALAYVLDVAPLHLIVPTTDDPPEYFITPELISIAAQVREWIRGRSPMGSQDPRTYFAEVPKEEWSPRPWTPEKVDFVSEQVRMRRAGGDDGQRQ